MRLRKCKNVACCTALRPTAAKPPWHMLSNSLAGWSGTGEEKDGSDPMRQGLAEPYPTCRKLALHKPTPSAGLEEQECHEFLGGGQGTVPIINKWEAQFPALAHRVILPPGTRKKTQLMVQGVYVVLDGTWSQVVAEKNVTPRDTPSGCFSQQENQLEWCRACAASPTTQGKSCLRGAAESGLWQHPERRLGQGWASTGRWMPRRASAKCVGLSKGRSSCRKSLGRKDRTDQPQSRQKA